MWPDNLNVNYNVIKCQCKTESKWLPSDAKIINEIKVWLQSSPENMYQHAIQNSMNTQKTGPYIFLCDNTPITRFFDTY